MSKLHELLAAEKTPTGAWNQVYEETVKKFAAPGHYFEGHTKSLAMIEDKPANAVLEAHAREEKPVTTTVADTLQYALDLFGKAEDLQYQKNATNRKATGTVLFRGKTLLADMPVDELLGLEARLTKIRILFTHAPTLDATKHWVPSPNDGAHIWIVKFPDNATKTEKISAPVTLKEATKEHPAQVQLVSRDEVVGKITTIRRSGAATALQKAEALKRIDDLLVEVKQARMRANETVVEAGSVAAILLPLLLEPFSSSAEDHQ